MSLENQNLNFKKLIQPFSFLNMAQTTYKGWNPNLVCNACMIHGSRYDHKLTDKCWSYCSHCGTNGHHMSFCYNLKFCNLCGKAGHNPYRCWTYSTISQWIWRAKELDRCVSCLAPWKGSDQNTKGEPGIIYCSHCDQGWHGTWKDLAPESKESQTDLVKECQKELQEGKNIIEKQRMQIEDLNSRLSSLEDRLESSKATIDDLDWRLQSITKEKEQELQKANKLDLLCKEKEMDLRKLSEQIGRKDFELEQHRKTSAQPSLTIPATAQQPCPTPTSNSLEHVKETNSIKATLTDIQDQQQKLSLIVNHLYNKIKTQDMNWLSYSSFNPCMGPYDTGQCFNKFQQV